MKFKKVISCLLATAIAAGGVVSGTANYSYLRTGLVSAAVSTAASTTVLKESAYVTWTAISGADGYNVYVKPEGGSYTQLDSMLIRQYNGYYRADAVGLKAGNYIMKVVPTTGGKEDTSKAVESASMKVESYDRSGYAFAKGKAIGAYNEDGTLKSNAIVVYVTNENKDTVTCELNAEGKGNVTCTGVQNIITAYKKGKETRPIAIRFIGNIEDPANMGKGDLLLDTVTAGMTLEGIGNDATLNGFGAVLKNCSNVEVRNLGFMNCNSDEGDNCGLQQGNTYCWVHNCDFFYGDAGSDADQVKGDGALDTKKSQYITHSYNHFYDNGKCNLQGANGSDTSNYITYHHNWYDHSDSRHPRVRVATVHVYNNYYDGNAKYGIGSTTDSDIFVENNYFRNCYKPMIISTQGSDTEKTLSGETGGMIKAYGNVITGAGSYKPYSENKSDFDCYDASSKTEQVPSSVKATNGGATYSNFDTASDMYSYNLDAAADIPAIVEAEAGRIDGGDFKWNFDDSKEDKNADVIPELKAALVAYDDSIVAIGSGFKSSAEVVEPTQAPTSATTTATTKAPDSSSTTIKTTTASTPSGEENVPSGVKVLGAGGWNEMMYLMASGVKAADVTAVSWSGASTGSLSAEDLKYLVRDVDGNLRVDVLGLKPGTYTLTLTTSKGTVSKSGINVGAQDRSGFAHYNYTSGVGAYNDDGTLKANAIVLYVNDANKDTVSVTSKDGTTVKGIGNILNSAGQDNGSGKTSKGGTPNTNSDIIEKLAKDGTPLVIRIVGNVTAPAGVTEFDSVNYGGSEGDNGYMARMQSGKDVTIEGVGTDACINGWGIHFIAETGNPDLGKSFEVRNIAFRNVPEDCVGMEGQQADDNKSLTAPVERCWIHNCEFYAPKISNPADGDKDGGDGACDFKRGQYFTNSYCYYEGYHKTNLVGSSDTSLQYHLTYHHNYWKSCESRGPLARQADIHMYNNVYDGQTSYCQNPRANAFIFSEYNYFLNSKDVCEVTSGGVVKSYMDTIENCRGNAQATVVTDKSKTVSSSCKYANFDTDASISYIPSGNYYLQTNTADLKGTFETDGGCMDEMSISGTVVTTTPTTGGGSDTTTTITTKVTDPITVPAGGVVHNFTLNGIDSTFYTIAGNLSTSKGTVSYAGLTLTQCLKMESATSIKFSNSAEGEITLVFAEAGKTVKIDGTKYTTDANGIVTATVAAGSHEITKGDAINLFYMVYTDDSASQTTTAPVTTQAPVETTTVSVTTQAPVDVTTTAPVTTQAPVDVTTTAPVTTQAPVDATTTVPVTTQAPVDATTTAPVTTQAPIVTTPAPTENIPDGTLYGDVNGDGLVDVADVVALNMYILNANENPLGDAEKANADCSRDNSINSTDSVLLMNYVSMLIDKAQLGAKPTV